MQAGDSPWPCSGMRKLKEVGGGAAAVLPAQANAASRSGAARPDGARTEPSRPIRRVGEPLRSRREMQDDFPGEPSSETLLRRNRRVRRGLTPQTRNGWLAAAAGALAAVAVLAAGGYMAGRYVVRSPRFRIPSSANIALAGNSHVTRAQMLSIFGGDVDRSIFRVPMEQRRAELEAMPWVEHATVMRLLPNRLRVQVTERVPVAFARQGGTIGLVDKDGVLLDIPPDAGSGTYTFPVVTGLRADDTADGRAERMKLYAAFLKDLDSDGKGASAQLSEIDLSNPEDAKALIPDHNSEILVHFGTDHFLERYRRFQEHVTEWRTQYPRLSGVDMRYDRQVVLQMPPKDSTVQPGSATQAEAHEPTSTGHAVATASRTAATTHANATSHTGAITRPAVAKPAPTHSPAPSKPHTAANDAATRKRVEAIKAWMARREKARAATQ